MDMVSIIINVLLLIFFIAPFSLLFHEIGHVTGATLMKASSTRLTLGVGKKIWQGQIQNIDIIIRRLFLVNSFTSTVRERPFLKKEKLIITLMGPAYNGVLAVILYGIYYIFLQSQLIYIFFLFNVWLVIINLLPFKIGQKESDGYTIYRLILGKSD